MSYIFSVRIDIDMISVPFAMTAFLIPQYLFHVVMIHALSVYQKSPSKLRYNRPPMAKKVAGLTSVQVVVVPSP